MYNDNLKESFKIYNIEENEVYNEEKQNLNFNSLYEMCNINKENNELISENKELKIKLDLHKTIILNIYSLVKDFNNKLELIIKDFRKILDNDKK